MKTRTKRERDNALGTLFALRVAGRAAFQAAGLSVASILEIASSVTIGFSSTRIALAETIDGRLFRLILAH